jgi:predicted RNase H-like nuclease (RuvC/YqgF family)
MRSQALEAARGQYATLLENLEPKPGNGKPKDRPDIASLSLNRRLVRNHGTENQETTPVVAMQREIDELDHEIERLQAEIAQIRKRIHETATPQFSK